MKAYTGQKINDGVGGQPVTLIDSSKVEALQERHDLVNHSPDGFNWGYGGSGPAQLAAAILADLVGDKDALKHYQQFKKDIIAGLDDEFTLTEEEIRNWLRLQLIKDGTVSWK